MTLVLCAIPHVTENAKAFLKQNPEIAPAIAQKLRKDNSQLRQHLASVQSENKRLAAKVDTAKTRLESLLAQIPDGVE